MEELVEKEKQPKLTDRASLFEWAPGIPIRNENEAQDIEEREENAEEQK